MYKERRKLHSLIFIKTHSPRILTKVNELSYSDGTHSGTPGVGRLWSWTHPFPELIEREASVVETVHTITAISWFNDGVVRISNLS